MGGVNEWTTRLPIALPSALAVPLLYWIGREVFPDRLPAVLSALVYLTLLPVVRHGRLAMHDGIAIAAFLLLLLCLLKARRNVQWTLGVGVALGIISFTKGVLSLPLGTIALIFLFVEGQMGLLLSPYLWVGMVLGNAPVVTWYALQGLHYGEVFWRVHFLSQSFDRLWQSVENNAGPPWYYVLEILKYTLPWLLFIPPGLKLSWEQRRTSWGRLILIGTIFYLGIISVMKTKLPWYVMPVYPFLALAVGAQLAQLWQNRKAYSVVWMGLLGVLAIGSLGAGTYIGWAESRPLLVLMGVVLGLTLAVAAGLMQRGDRHFIPVLFTGLYLALLILMSSNFWLWELNEAFPVKPVAALLQANLPPRTKAYITFPYGRPSLDFYSDRQVSPISSEDLKSLWSTPSYVLLDQPSLNARHLDRKILGTAAGFTLVQTQPTS